MDIDSIVREWSGTAEDLLIFVLTRCQIDAEGRVSLAQGIDHRLDSGAPSGPLSVDGFELDDTGEQLGVLALELFEAS